MPDGKVKKQLAHIEGKPYRIRSGDYRILYTYDNQTITVYKIERRNEGTYKKNQAIVPEYDEAHADLDIEFDDVESVHNPSPSYNMSPQWYEGDTSQRLPEPITPELLTTLNVAPEYFTRLLRVQTQDQLLTCPGIDDDTLLSINAYLFETPLKQAMQQLDLVLNEVEDLLRYKEGELLAFLLKLSPEQEKFATWSLKATGPTLVKGGPGTGKSTVALYRVRSLLHQLLKNKAVEEPRVLFTTYTNALVRSSEQLLEQLLGDEAAYVRVWRQEPSFNIAGPLPGGDLTDPPPSVMLVLADPSSSAISNPALTLTHGSQVAELKLPVDNYVVSGSKTVQVEIKE